MVVASSLAGTLGPHGQELVAGGRPEHQEVLVVGVGILLAMRDVDHHVGIAACPFSFAVTALGHVMGSWVMMGGQRAAHWVRAPPPVRPGAGWQSPAAAAYPPYIPTSRPASSIARKFGTGM